MYNSDIIYLYLDVISYCFHPPISMRILEYHIKNAGWKRQDSHKFSIEVDTFRWIV